MAEPLATLELAPAARQGAFRRTGEPVCTGFPFPRGLVRDEGLIELISHGRPTPVQTTVTERWSDGSIKWALLEFQASTDDSGYAEYSVQTRDSSSAQPPGVAIGVTHQSSGPVIDSGTVRGTFSGLVAAPVVFEPSESSSTNAVSLAVEIDAAGAETLRPLFGDPVVEHAGALTTRVRMSGRLVLPQTGRPLNVTLRAQLFAGLPVVSVSLTVHNPSRARHPNGIWQLGDTGSILLRDVSIRLTLPASECARDIRYCEHPGSTAVVTSPPWRLYQDSSGGERWDSRTHVTRDGAVAPTFKGYEVLEGGRTRRGARATPIVALRSNSNSLSVAMTHFWENFPKTLEADERSIVLRLFPKDARSLHEIQGGEQKRHDFTVCIGADPITADPLRWVTSPLIAAAPPQWYVDCEALSRLVAFNADVPSEDLMHAGLDGRASFESKREQIDEFGWRNFGEVYADHEAVHHHDLVSHYNNQYDPIAGFGRQFMRTGNRRWFALMATLARHVADIDIYHTSEDKAAYNGGLFWHTFHYIDAGRSTHRSFPEAPGVNGGGPSCEHNYAAGLALHYLLTGDPDSREAVLLLANWIVHMDDGRRNVFGWLDRGPTGWASATGSSDYHGPGRGAGNSILALLTATRLVDDPRFVRKVDELIRRCIHPADDPADHQLLDAERRWSYTVFLQALGSYLAYKHERSELDEHYGYARESLLTYARWMARNEYPFLDKPEILEYPNETWAAQDLRKADVFVLARLCARGDERDTFRERAEFFFRHSIATLQSMPTRSLSRPQVLLLAYAGSVPWMRRHPDAVLPDAVSTPDAPQPGRERFVPQKVRALRRARTLALALIGATVLLLMRACL